MKGSPTQERVCHEMFIDNRPWDRYGFAPPPRGNFGDYNFHVVQCHTTFLKHVSPLTTIT